MSTEQKQQVLIVEDESDIRSMLAFALQDAFDIVFAVDGIQGWETIQRSQPDLVLLDWMMPGMDGMELLRLIRQHELLNNTPVILLTAKTNETSHVRGLNAGADDYIFKPFSPASLIARIHSLLRRVGHSAAATSGEPLGIHFRGRWVRLNHDSQRLVIDSNELKISPLEFKFMDLFIQHPRQIFTRQEIIKQVWHQDMVLELRTVDVHIRRLRKLLDQADIGDMIETIYSTGYLCHAD